ncbi:TrkH family potassium uptake protein [Paeniglutamicibacter cryotolerans]|uniref:Potassium uptake TrkH family protein n=1 Tax=Paeniglutamicibacter cryotolerans TaxID=670079 RepID=A0A839QF36_9MICC|nr:potassium transporter TrkG [Paeniglutamicibacter cryotolerans]MBB2994878.1 potassium uptake TrkH family protein [Paeniglutamicibacter cryotolerans]
MHAAALPRALGRALLPRHPAQAIALGFGTAILLGTTLLMLPISKVGPGGADFLSALFTATSAVCVTGLAVVDTATYWTPFGQVAILLMIQLGGFGIMSFASLLAVLMARRLGLKSRISAATETKSRGFGDVRSVLLGVLKTTIVVELIVAALLALRFGFGYGSSPWHALWQGVFHSVSAFNNAGFALFSDNLMGFVGDPWICLPIAAAIIVGGLGFPVLFELHRQYRKPLHWTMNTKLVLSGTAILLTTGTAFITALEWDNPGTLGRLSSADKLLAGFFQSVMTRTAGFNSVDLSQMDPATWLGMDILMFIGGGPAGTAGGLKITTFAVLFFILLTEIRGGTAVNVFGKRLSRSVHRQAITIVLLAVALVVGSTMTLMLITDFSFDALLFETISAFATVGLSTGITAALPPAGQLLLVLLMFVGRLGPVTLASALALRSRQLLYEFPKERPLIG